MQYFFVSFIWIYVASLLFLWYNFCGFTFVGYAALYFTTLLVQAVTVLPAGIVWVRSFCASKKKRKGSVP